MSNQSPQGQNQPKQEQKGAPKKVYRVHAHGALEHNGTTYQPGMRAPDMSDAEREALGSAVVEAVD